MDTIAGIFNTRAAAERAVERLRSVGVTDDHIISLAPGASDQELDAAVPTTETEQPGMGKALGGAVGGALGVAGGMHAGAALASLFIPGVGPVLAAGILGAALLGAGGATAGMAAGGAMEDNIASGLPQDELYVYEDALRQGRTVIIAITEDGAQADTVRGVLGQAGAESVDAARESWWIGLRDAEAEAYASEGADFKSDESVYRRGFEAAVHPKMRGRSYTDATEHLRERYHDVYGVPAFRRGYERGQTYHQSLQEKYTR